MSNHQTNHLNHVPSDSEEVCAHDWEEEKRRAKDFYDDGTVTWFWYNFVLCLIVPVTIIFLRAHTVTTLLVFAAILVYVALFEESNPDPDYNSKRGLVACLLAFILFGCTHLPDGPFCRPHPAFWRFLLMLSIVYELALVFLLFQNVNEARQLLTQLDPTLGKPLPEKNYGGNCHLYDYDNPGDPYHNIWDKMDGFVVVHFFGWWLKTLILRDYWLCMVISIMFEVLEYTLEHQLPNFSECWWDHWIMDALVCNGLGIYLGMKTLNYLSLKPYHWSGMWNIPSVRGKVFRIMRQFTPYCWTDFDWRPISSLGRWVAMLGVIGIFLLAELNTFYLKFVLWIPPPHFLCLGRLAMFLFWGAAAMRETFEYMDNPSCKSFGTQAWVVAAIIITELLITLKFDWETITTPLPKHIQLVWICFMVILALWTVWHFWLKRLIRHTEKKIANGSHAQNNNGAQVVQGNIQNGNYLSSLRQRKPVS